MLRADAGLATATEMLQNRTRGKYTRTLGHQPGQSAGTPAAGPSTSPGAP
jgi:hypothetical protein